MNLFSVVSHLKIVGFYFTIPTFFLGLVAVDAASEDEKSFFKY